MNLSQAIERSRLNDPEQPALIFENVIWSYQRLDNAASATAKRLAELGVQRGDCVALLLPNSPAFLLAYFGALKLGEVASGKPDVLPRRLADGGFVVTWTYGGGIYGQRYDESGQPANLQFLINTTTTGTKSSSFVKSLPDGGFVVTWNSDGNPYGQNFDSFGNPERITVKTGTGANDHITSAGDYRLRPCCTGGASGFT